MGTLAAHIKAAEAEVKQSADGFLDQLRQAWTGEGLDTRTPGEKETFQQQTSQLQAAAKAPGAAQADIEAMRMQGIPTSSEESRKRALKWALGIGLGAVGVGALLRALRGMRKLRQTPIAPTAGLAVPSREISVRLPKAAGKQGMDKEARWYADDAADWLRRRARGIGQHLTTSTGSPFDSVWFPTLALAAGAGGAYLGYKGIGKLLDAMAERRKRRQLEEAKREFERALMAQSREADLAGEAGVKYSSEIGEAASILADAHVSGELYAHLASMEKAGAAEDDPTQESWIPKGLGWKSMGIYLALLAALGTAGGAAGYHYARKSDPSRRRYKALRKVLRRRQMATPSIPYVRAE